MERIGWTVGSGVAAFAATPLVVTGAFAVVQALPTWPTFGVLFMAAVGLWVYSRELRSVAVGVATAAVAHAVFLAWLFGSMRGLDGI